MARIQLPTAHTTLERLSAPLTASEVSLVRASVGITVATFGSVSATLQIGYDKTIEKGKDSSDKGKDAKDAKDTKESKDVKDGKDDKDKEGKEPDVKTQELTTMINPVLAHSQSGAVTAIHRSLLVIAPVL
jgi:hypothetical protein